MQTLTHRLLAAVLMVLIVAGTMTKSLDQAVRHTETDRAARTPATGMQARPEPIADTVVSPLARALVAASCAAPDVVVASRARACALVRPGTSRSTKARRRAQTILRV